MTRHKTLRNKKKMDDAAREMMLKQKHYEMKAHEEYEAEFNKRRLFIMGLLKTKLRWYHKILRWFNGDAVAKLAEVVNDDKGWGIKLYGNIYYPPVD